MTGPMDLGRVGIWTGALDGVSSRAAQHAAALLEDYGFRTLWIPESSFGRDPFVTAALLLSAAPQLRVATGIASIYARDAVTTANAQRTLDEAFPGRFLLGLGVSHQFLVETVRHHDYSKPYSAMATYLDQMDSAPFQAVGPAQRPETVLAALGPKMLQLAAQRADGAHTYMAPVEHTESARNILGPDTILAVEQKVVLEDDRTVALAIARESLAPYLRAVNYVNNLRRFGFDDDDFVDGGSTRLIDALVVHGDADTVRDRVRAHFDAGASHVCIQVLQQDDAWLPTDAREAPAAMLPAEEWRALAAALH